MTISSAALEALLKMQDDDPVILLVTLWHPQIPTLRFARNLTGQNVTSRGETFSAIPFAIKLPNDDDEVPTIQFSFPNVDRAIGQALLTINSPLRLTLEAVLNSDTNDVIRRYAWFELINVQFDALVVQGELVQSQFTTEPYPNKRVMPNNFSALFRK